MAVAIKLIKVALSYILISVFLMCGCRNERVKSKEDKLVINSFGEKSKSILFEEHINPDLKWYLEKIESLIKEGKGKNVSAEDYYRLWTNSYAYRDFTGAKIIAESIYNRGGSVYWRNCFLTLALGQEKYPSIIDGFTESDLIKGDQFVINHLFSYSQLKSCKLVFFEQYSKLLKSAWEEGIDRGLYNEPGTIVDHYKADEIRLGKKNVLLNFEKKDFILTKIAVAINAFRSCYYESGKKYLDEIIRENLKKSKKVNCEEIGSGACKEILLLMYYAGYTINMEQDPKNEEYVNLEIDNGMIFKIKRIYYDDKIKLLVMLSKEKESFPWEKPNNGKNDGMYRKN